MGEEPKRTEAERREGWPFVGCPERDRGRTYRLIYPRAGERLTVVSVADRVRGVLHHYYGGRNYLCRRAWEPCDGCRLADQVRWQGYLPVLLLPSRVRRVLVLTEAGYLNAPGLRALEGKLRGVCIVAFRPGEARNRPVEYSAKILPFDENLPLPHDIGPSLCCVWGISEETTIGQAILSGARADTPRREEPTNGQPKSAVPPGPVGGVPGCDPAGPDGGRAEEG